jgi:hypothetical protein
MRRAHDRYWVTMTFYECAPQRNGRHAEMTHVQEEQDEIMVDPNSEW